MEDIKGNKIESNNHLDRIEESALGAVVGRGCDIAPRENVSARFRDVVRSLDTVTLQIGTHGAVLHYLIRVTVRRALCLGGVLIRLRTGKLY